jgi:hypothetical protein
MTERVEIEAASLAQVRRSKKGTLVVVDDDVQNVARDLKDIDKSLRLEYDPHEEFFVVTQHRVLGDGSVEEHLVTTSRACDQRLVQRVREISDPRYDYAGELEKAEDAANRAREQKFEEQIGAGSEQLAHALRKDLGLSGGRAFIGRRDG